MTLIATRLSSRVEAGFSASPEFKTNVHELRSGQETRNADWATPRRKFSASYAAFSATDRAELVNCQMACRGQTHTFLFKDWMDFRAIGQSLGNAPSGTTAVQLVKTYTYGTETFTRTIKRPVNGTVTVYEGGVAKPGTYSTSTGLFTPTSAWATLPTPSISSVTAATTGGSLASGATYSYRVSATSASGETLASTAVSVAVAAALATPVNAAFTTATTGGTLAAATYSYRVAAKNAIGSTLASTATTIATTGTTSTVTVNWGAVSGATGYDVFGRVGGSELLIASVGAVTTYTDDGSITPAGALPAANTTATETNTATVNWGAVTDATGYKVYGRTSGSELLIATVGAVTTYTDNGSVTPSGALPTANESGGTLTADFEFDVVVRFANDFVEFVMPHRDVAEVQVELREVRE